MSKAPNYYLNERIYENSDKSITIFKTRRRQAISYMAVKVYNKKRHYENYDYEYKILKNISCSSIVNVLGYAEDYANYYLEMEFCASGDLSKCLWPNKSSSYFEKVLKTVSTQLLLGLQNLHVNGVIHCNLKPSNILIDEFGNVKICDFKKSLKTNEMTIAEIKKNKQAMTPCYTAPELFGDDGAYSYKTDLWALGCIMYEMAVGQVPFFDEVVNKLINKILTEDINFNKKQLTLYSNEFMDVLKKLLEKDPSSRASWGEIEKMPFWDLSNKDESYSTNINYTNNSQIPTVNSFKGKAVSAMDKDSQSNNILINNEDQEDYSNERNSNGVDNTDKEFKFQNNDKLITDEDNNYYNAKTASSQRGNYNDNNINANIPHNMLEVSVLNVSKIMQRDKRAIKEEINDLAYSLANNNDLPQIENIMMHNSDRIIKPIIGNQLIEKAILIPLCISSKLPFPIWKIDKIKQLVINGDTARLESYLLNAYQVMDQYEKKSNEDGLLNLLAYFETIILSKEVANNLINTSFVYKFIMYLDINNDEIRIKACSIIGYLIRYATTMEKPLDKYNLCDKLISFISDNNIQLSRKAIATLGEYLFFVSTQAEGEDNDANIWTVTRESLMALLYALNHSDGIVRFYSLKTIENISILTTISKVFFASNEDFIVKIIELYNSSIESPDLKTSALSTISQLIRHEPTLVNVFINQIGSLSSSIKSESPKNQQCLINCVLFAIVGNNKTVQYFDLDSLVSSLISLLEFGNDIIKKKIILFLGLTFNVISIIDKYGDKIFTLMQKLRIEKEKFYYFVKIFESFMINYCKGFNKIFLSIKNKEIIINYLKCFSRIGNYHKISFALFNSDLLDRLILLLDSCNDDDIIKPIFDVLLTFSENSFSVDENSDLIIKTLFVNILNLTIKMSIDNKRFPLNICANILTVLLDDEKLYSSTILEEGKTKLINNLIITILPFIYDLLKSEDTIIDSLSFLSLIIERNSAFIRFYRSVSIIDYIFYLLNDPNFYSNLNLIKILIKLIESNDTSFDDIINMKLIDKLNFLISKDSDDVSNYTEYIIEMLFDLMFKINEYKKKKYANKYEKEDYKKNFTSKIESVAVNFKLCVKLLGCDNINIQEKSCVILIFMLQLFPETYVQSIGVWVKFSIEDIPNLLKGLDSNCKKIHKRMIRIFRWIIEFQDDAAVILKPYVSYVQIYVEKIKDSSSDSEVVSLAIKFLANDLKKIIGGN